jgi:hypothetical protein
MRVAKPEDRAIWTSSCISAQATAEGYSDMARVKRALEDDLGVTVDLQIAKGDVSASETLQNTARVL